MYSRSFSTMPVEGGRQRFKHFSSRVLSLRRKVGGRGRKPDVSATNLVFRKGAETVKRQIRLKLEDMEQCLWLLRCELESKDTLILLKCVEETAERIDRLVEEMGYLDGGKREQ